MTEEPSKGGLHDSKTVSISDDDEAYDDTHTAANMRKKKIKRKIDSLQRKHTQMDGFN